MKKQKIKEKNDKIIIFIIILLLFFSYFEIKGNLRFGGLLRDALFFNYNNSNNLVNILNKELKEENKLLKNKLELDYSLTDFDIINASVIERNTTYWLSEITINKGLNDGIVNNLAVVTEDGLIGKIIDTSFNTSKVKLITELNSISVKINNNNKILTIEDNILKIRGINYFDNIKKDNLVLTSGLSDIFPSGIIIGKIKEVIKEKDEVGYFAKVELSSNINDLKYVMILKRRIK